MDKIKINIRIDSNLEGDLVKRLSLLAPKAHKHRLKIKKEDFIAHILSVGLAHYDQDEYIDSLVNE